MATIHPSTPIGLDVWGLGGVCPDRLEHLIQALDDDFTDVRRNAAGALGKIDDPRADERLMAGLWDGDLDVTVGAYPFFIARGESGTEEALATALSALGDDEMASVFLHCGNERLAEAARTWAKLRLWHEGPLPAPASPVVWRSGR